MFADKEYSHPWKCNHARLKSLDYTQLLPIFFMIWSPKTHVLRAHTYYMSHGMRFPRIWYVRPACAYAQTYQSLCWSLKYSMTVKLLTEPHLRFLSLKGGRTGSSESTLVKIPHCWKSNVMVIYFTFNHDSPPKFAMSIFVTAKKCSCND